MRAALHLPRSSSSPTSAAQRGRHRFVQDGEVPVVTINPRPHRSEDERAALAELERALASEREARQVAEKALHQAGETIRQLQTRLAHAEMARQEVTRLAAPQPPQVEEVKRPKPLPKQRTPKPAKDEVVEWWKPGWKERFRNRSR